MKRARFIAAARVEFLAEVIYYNDAEPGLGGRFAAAVEEASSRALVFPFRHTEPFAYAANDRARLSILHLLSRGARRHCYLCCGASCKASLLLDVSRTRPLTLVRADAHEVARRSTFCHANGAMLSVPVRRPIKPVYIRKFVRLIEEGTAE